VVNPREIEGSISKIEQEKIENQIQQKQEKAEGISD
jgi:hypothetical protein